MKRTPPIVVDCTFIDWVSSVHRVARRDAVESRALLLEGSDNPYLSFTYWLTEFILPWTLLVLGEWGEMLREGETGIAIATKNADDVEK